MFVELPVNLETTQLIQTSTEGDIVYNNIGIWQKSSIFVKLHLETHEL